MSRLSYRESLSLLVLCLASLPTVGCSSLPAPGAIGSAQQVDSQTVPHATVELRRSERAADPVTVPLQGDMRVQNVLDAAGVLGKVRDMQITIYRAAPNHPQQTIKLVSHYDRREKRVRLESDYAVLPGDHLVVQEKHHSMMDEILDGIMGPIFSGDDS